MADFMSGFLEAVPTGMNLNQQWREKKQENRTARAMEILAQYGQFDPTAGQFDATQQGMPEQGQTNAANGYSGAGVAELNKAFFDEISGFSNMDDFIKAKAAMGAVRMERINTAGMAAIQALRNGDTAGAQRHMGIATAFISPNYSEVGAGQGPDGRPYLAVANYDEGGSPSGGMALTEESILQMISQNQDPLAWSEFDVKRDYYNNQTDLAYKRFGEEQRHTRFEEARAQTSDERAALESQARLAGQNLQNLLTGLNIDEAKQKAINEAVAEEEAIWADLGKFNKTEADELKAAQPPLGSYETDPILYNQESGGDFGKDNKLGYRGRIQWGRDRFQDAVNAGAIPNGVTFEEFTSGSPESIKLQKNAERWHWYDIDNFIYDNGFENRLGTKDANGTTISWAGMRFAAHIGGKGGLDNWIRNGVEMPDVNNQGPGSYMKLGLKAAKAGPEAGPAQGEKEAVPTYAGYDPNTGLPLDPSQKPEDEWALDPWLFNPPNANGEVTKRPEIWEGMAALAADLKVNNPESTARARATLAFEAFGAKPRTELDLGDPNTADDDYITDGISKLKISPQMADILNVFDRDNAALRAKFEEERNPKPFETYTDEYQLPPQQAPQVAAAGIPAPGQAPGLAAAAAPAPAGAIPEPAPATLAGPQTVDPTAVRTGPPPVPPELSGAQPAQQVSDPYNLVREFQPPAAGQYANQVPLPKTISQVPPLAQAVRTWMAAGLTPGGPEEAAVMQIVNTLPPNLRPWVEKELAMVTRMRQQ